MDTYWRAVYLNSLRLTSVGVRARGAGGLQNHYLRAKAKFFGQKPAAENERNFFSVVIKRKKKQNSFRLAR